MQQGSGSLRLRIPIPAAATPADAAVAAAAAAALAAAAAAPRGAQSPSGFSISPQGSLAVQIEGAVSPSGLPKGGEHEARVVSKFAKYYSTAYGATVQYSL